MFMQIIFTLIFFFNAISLRASEKNDISAYRHPEVSYESFEQWMIKRIRNVSLYKSSAIGSATYFSENNLPDTTSWDSLSNLEKRFQGVRNDRHLRWPRRPDFLRRISWLYPNDGCYARAAMANIWFKARRIDVPGKVFAFGNLLVRTKNHPRGYVSWWYHVAPIIQVGKSHLVLDPSIDPSGPLPLRQWLSRMGNPAKIKVSICSPGAYSPRSRCSSETIGTSGTSAQKEFLDREWDQLKRMGRSPDELLGANPPWLDWPRFYLR